MKNDKNSDKTFNAVFN